MSNRELDELPFGVIRLSNEGVILAYNKAESAISSNKAKDVIGKRFFDEVAPCAKVSAFYVEFLRLTSQSVNGRKELSFMFRFETGALAVKITLLYDARKECTLVLVKPIVRENLVEGRAWMPNSAIVETALPIQNSELFREPDSRLSTDKAQIGLSLNQSFRTESGQPHPRLQNESYSPGGDIRLLIDYVLSIIHY
jgi:photoactive yellow protein